MPVRKSFASNYLNAQGLGLDGRPLGAKEKPLSPDELRVTLANDIADRLCEAYAMIEVAKELGIFVDEYATNIMTVAKDKTSTKPYRTPWHKKHIYEAINKSLGKANKALVGVGVTINTLVKPDFE